MAIIFVSLKSKMYLMRRKMSLLVIIVIVDVVYIIGSYKGQSLTPSKVNCMVSKMHRTVVIVYRGLMLNLKSIDLRYLSPINVPATDRKKAHSLMMSKVSNGRAVTPSASSSLPLVTTISRNKLKAKAR